MTPTTAAGRKLLSVVYDEPGHPTDGSYPNSGLAPLVLAIEAEAAERMTPLASEVTELRAGLPTLRQQMMDALAFPYGGMMAMGHFDNFFAALLSAGDKAEAPTCPDCGRSDEHAAPCTNRMRLGDKAEAPR